jgi:hypothetical protein
MIKLCIKHGHITGFRTCSCGSATEGQRPPFTEFPHVTAARLARVARHRELLAENPEPSAEQERRRAQSKADKVNARSNAATGPVRNSIKNWARGRRNA